MTTSRRAAFLMALALPTAGAAATGSLPAAADQQTGEFQVEITEKTIARESYHVVKALEWGDGQRLQVAAGFRLTAEQARITLRGVHARGRLLISPGASARFWPRTTTQDSDTRPGG